MMIGVMKWSRHYVMIMIILFTIYMIYLYKIPNDNDTLETVHNKGSFDNVPQKQSYLFEIQNYLPTTEECLNYGKYASTIHMKQDNELNTDISFQRPPKICRTFQSNLIDKFITQFKKRLKNPNLARIFENTLPNTLDTTILWHVTSEENHRLNNHPNKQFQHRNEIPETFVVTGDIHAEWLRDSTWQLSVYFPFIKYDSSLRELIRGAINTQAQLLMSSPYCNAFHPPFYSGINRGSTSFDSVRPNPNWSSVFECKYEIDSLASFLRLSRQFYESIPGSRKYDIINKDWLSAVNELLVVISKESTSTFHNDGSINKYCYTFQRDTNIGSETLPLAGSGNPINSGTGLVRSPFRPSDDSTIFQFFIPGNAYIAVELEKISEMLIEYRKLYAPQEISKLNIFWNQVNHIINLTCKFSQNIRKGIMKHAVVEHPEFGSVFAYEIDGYGSRLFMDDANIPSLLSLPLLEFVPKTNYIYKNTRRMILSSKWNPYFINGTYFQGIGGPHVDIHNVWPLSLIIQMRTSEDEEEIIQCLEQLLNSTGGLGLMHESINAFIPHGDSYTRPWFAWVNSEFSKAILQLAEQNPHIIFKEEYLNKKFDLDDFLKTLV